MSPRATYLVLLGVVVVFGFGAWYFLEGRAQRTDAARRLRLADGQPVRRRTRSALDARMRTTRPGRALDGRLIASGIDIGLSDALLVLCAAVAVAGLVGALVFGPLGGVLVAAGVAFACTRYVDYRQTQLREQFLTQLPELAWTMASASAAGLALPRTIEFAAGELGRPASDVLQRVVEELRIGQSLDRALENLRSRMPSREVGVLVSTLTIHQRTGGDTVAALREMSHTLDARKELRREVRTTISGAVATAWGVGGVAIGGLLVLSRMMPTALQDMLQTGLGQIALAFGLGLFALAFWLIRRTIRIET